MTTTHDHPDLAAIAVRCVREMMRADEYCKQLAALRETVCKLQSEVDPLMADAQARIAELEREITAWQTATGCTSPGDAARRLVHTAEQRDAAVGRSEHAERQAEERRKQYVQESAERDNAERERDAAQTRSAELETAHAATRRELERWKRWQQIEGDYVCENGDIARCPHAVERGLKKERDMSLARCSELERELEAAVRRADLGTAQILAIASVIDGDDRGETRDHPRWTPTLAHARRLRSQLATVTAERAESWNEGARALSQWLGEQPSSWGDFYATNPYEKPATTPQANPLCVPSEDGPHKHPDCPLCVPEPRTLTAEEVEQHLLDGSAVSVEWNETTTNVYRVRSNRLFWQDGGEWVHATRNLAHLVHAIDRAGLRCTLVPDPSQEQEVRS